MSDHWIRLSVNDLRGYCNKSLDNAPDTSTSRRTQYGWGSAACLPRSTGYWPAGEFTQKGTKAQFDKRLLTKWLKAKLARILLENEGQESG